MERRDVAVGSCGMLLFVGDKQFDGDLKLGPRGPKLGPGHQELDPGYQKSALGTKIRTWGARLGLGDLGLGRDRQVR